MAEIESVSDHLARHYDRQVARITDRLRRLADDLDNRRRQGNRLSDAADVEHALRWGYANLPIDALLRAAQEHHEYVTKESS